MTDLSDFGAGTATGGEAGPEHRAKQNLTTWLEDYGARVWWEERNQYDHKVFTIERAADTGGRPDLLIEIEDVALVVEFKTGNAGGQLCRALAQLHRYWLEHITHEQTFIAGGREIAIDGFLTATQQTPDGHLFPRYDEPEPLVFDDMSDGRQAAVNAGDLPAAEYPMTEQHIRTLWQLAKEQKDNISVSDATPYIGSLLSDAVLPRTRGRGRPAVLWNKGGQDWRVFDNE